MWEEWRDAAVDRGTPVVEGAVVSASEGVGSWVASSGASISRLTDYKPDGLVAFAEVMEAVLTGDESHPRVKRTG